MRVVEKIKSLNNQIKSFVFLRFWHIERKIKKEIILENIDFVLCLGDVILRLFMF